MALSPPESRDYIPQQPIRSSPRPSPMEPRPTVIPHETLQSGIRHTEIPAVRGSQGFLQDQSEIGPAPKPCERCVRTGRTCRGVANARCEYCKRLKQKCSNSTGPARGKHAAAARLAASGAALPKGPGSSPIIPSEPASAPLLSQKRKAEDRHDGPSHRTALDNVDAHEEEESEGDGHDLPARFNKKRRTAISSAIIASRVLRHVKDLEATVRRLEDVYHTEMMRVDTIISQLMKDMEGLTGDSEREASLDSATHRPQI